MNSSPYAVVVGAVNLDIRGTPYKPPVARDSNPGRVAMSLGGVGRNLAHNLALLGLPTHFLTALGDDMTAQRVEWSCQELGIDVSRALRVPGGSSSTYLFLTDERGEMELAVSDMDVYDAITPQYLERNLEFLNGAELVVADTNLPVPALAFLARRLTSPLYVDPVSTAKAAKLPDILDGIHTLKPNRLEAELLSGMPIRDEVTLQLAAGALLDKGVKEVFISLGAEGALAANSQRIVHLPPISGRIVNATGCGDAFTAALAWARFQGLGLEDSARAGLAAGAVALAGEETIKPKLSAQLVRELAGL